MRLHSVADIITNSSTQTYGMVLGEDKLYEFLNNMLRMVGIDEDARELYHVDWKFENPYDYYDWVLRQAYQEEIDVSYIPTDWWRGNSNEEIEKLGDDNGWTRDTYLEQCEYDELKSTCFVIYAKTTNAPSPITLKHTDLFWFRSFYNG